MVTIFGPRKNAAVFPTKGDAQSAIFRIPSAFKGAETAFAVEAADD
jgi:hypothetical protein